RWRPRLTRSPLFPYTTLFRSPNVRMTGVRALARVGGAGAVSTLSEIAANGPESANARAALAGIMGPDVEAALIRIANEGKPNERSEEHTSELQSRGHLVCRLL